MLPPMLPLTLLDTDLDRPRYLLLRRDRGILDLG